MDELTTEAARLAGSTERQRRALFRMGKSRWYVRQFAGTKSAASRAIAAALRERQELETGQHR